MYTFKREHLKQNPSIKSLTHMDSIVGVVFRTTETRDGEDVVVDYPSIDSVLASVYDDDTGGTDSDIDYRSASQIEDRLFVMATGYLNNTSPFVDGVEPIERKIFSKLVRHLENIDTLYETCYFVPNTENNVAGIADFIVGVNGQMWLMRILYCPDDTDLEYERQISSFLCSTLIKNGVDVVGARHIIATDIDSVEEVITIQELEPWVDEYEKSMVHYNNVCQKYNLPLRATP